MFRLLFISSVMFFFLQDSAVADDTRNEARIGVLAYRGSHQLQRNWLALGQYLDSSIPGWSFRIVPMTLQSARKQIEAGQVDFIITNPGHFVDLNRTHRMSVIASRSQKKSDGSFSGEFGSAIITLKDSGIDELQDVAGSTVSAIDLYAFGGFQLAWNEFERAGVDLFTDTERLKFVGFPMDQIVMQVLAGETDVGIVRTGLIEELAREGKIDPEAFTYLNSNVAYSHPDKISTGLYPEWPFVALATTAPTLIDQVALALLLAQDSPAAITHGIEDRWSAPVPYHSALELTAAFQARILDLDGQNQGITRITIWAGLSVVFVALSIFSWRKLRSRPQISMTEHPPDKAEVAGLTRREREVLALVAQGNSTKEIAIKLGISPKTVEFHRANLLRKFGARTSSQLVSLAT
ncbi:PhnD/SsuA/transferrin family substrate-binding protein [uncultured Sulfitobacter sp.]|uniref:PhnD/SsuA/transferrin family substrate-binding protein n=1 Tax=uncultured Sulfitobacter sp. TaxID=191468 RepID=UPI002621AB08|nr:PhnD/SsuA/transferrin family substrate-binding protein [uncultured Sulfitobacter sp.]